MLIFVGMSALACTDSHDPSATPQAVVDAPRNDDASSTGGESQAVAAPLVPPPISTAPTVEPDRLPTPDLAELYRYKTDREQIAISGDGRIMFTASQDRKQPHVFHEAVWDLATGKKRGSWDTHFKSAALQLSHDGSLLVSTGRVVAERSPRGIRNEVRVVELPGGNVRTTVEMPAKGFGGGIGLLPTGELYDVHLADFRETRGLFQVDMDSGAATLLTERVPFPACFLMQSGRFIAMSQVGRSAYHRLRVFKSVDDFVQQKMEWDLGAFGAARLSCSLDERWLGMFHRVPDGEMFSLFDLEDGKRTAQHRFAGNTTGLTYLSPDGKYATTSTGGKLFVLDAQTKSTALYDEARAPAGFTPGGAIIIQGAVQPFEFIDPASGERLPKPLAEKWLTPVASLPPARVEAAVKESPAEPPLRRTWTSADGKFRVEAELVKVIDGNVILKRHDGREVQVPIDKLSNADIEFIK